jgi:Zn-dependent M28 family amino/carboxypeptidase
MYRSIGLLVCLIFIMFSARCQTALLDSIVNKAAVKALVEYLSSDSLKGRFTGTQEARIAAEFIANEFGSAGVNPIAGFDGYFMPFTGQSRYVRNVVTGYNVLSALGGKTKGKEIIMFSAHYDHIGTISTDPFKINRPRNKSDSIYNGANDDASGVAAVILLARYFAALNNNDRTLLFVAFSGEELGLVGSMALSQQLEPNQIKAVINIEMIGRNPRKQIHPYITGAKFSNLKKLLNTSLMKYDGKKYGKSFYVDDPYPEEQLFTRSDHWSFAGLGIPAHSIMLTSPRDEYYHSTDDEVDTLDFDVMTQIIHAIALSCESLVKGSSTPNRIK